MANNNNNNSTMSLRSVLEKDKLTGTNFLDWFRNLRIVLKQERKLYVLDEPLPEEPAKNVPRVEKNAYEKHHNDSIDVACLMLATMSSELQKDLENMEAYDMILILRKCSSNKQGKKGMRLPRHCILARWLRVLQLVLMFQK